VGDDAMGLGRAALNGSAVNRLWLDLRGKDVGELGVYGVAAGDRHVYFHTGDTNAGGGKGYIGRVATDGTGLVPKLITRQRLGITLSTGP
jgi:hypothetical protein